MIELKLIDPHWINQEPDDTSDQCAHGRIKFVVDNLVISDADQTWTVSAAALFLLRTVFHNHSETNSVAENNYLIPCCGFTVIKDDDYSDFGLLILGCVGGINPQIIHNESMVTIVYKNQSRTVELSAWADAIVGFADEVIAYYNSCSPKVDPTDNHDLESWKLFWTEFRENKDRASEIAKSS